MTTNLSVAPYYDDYDPASDYHQILFKPGVSVQARELTQSQSILRNQIAQFGGHVFKHGSVVMPGNSTTDFHVSYVKIQTTDFDVTGFVGQTLVGENSGLRAYVKFATQPTATDPAVLYVTYYNTGLTSLGLPGQKFFIPGERISNGFDNILVSLTSPTGPSVLASVSKGVFFVNGTFANVNPQTVVISKYSTVPSCHVLLKITESIVNANDDSTLLDPAQGSYNYSAPGADRLKITLTLVTLPLGTSFGDDYIELMRYENGELLEHLRYSKYSELEKNLARRTYDESGDYVVRGMDVTAREHFKTAYNNGRYAYGDLSKFILTASAGKAYVNGYETEIFAHKEIVVDKARTAAHLKTNVVNLIPSFGQYLTVTDIAGLPDFKTQATLTFWSRLTGGVALGTANALMLDFKESAGASLAENIYTLYLTEIKFTAPETSLSDIARISFTGGTMSVLHRLTVSTTSATDFETDEIISFGTTRKAKVRSFSRITGFLYVIKHDLSDLKVPVNGDSITAPSGATGRVIETNIVNKNQISSLIFDLPKAAVKSVSGVSYTSYFTATATADATGAASWNITSGEPEDPDIANTIVCSSDGTIMINPDQLSFSTSSISITTPNLAYANKVLKLICTVKRSPTILGGSSPKTKTVTSQQDTVASLVNRVGILTKTDGLRLKSVKAGGIEYINRFTFDNGQTDYNYGLSSIVYTSSLPQPAGPFTVIYDYFSHSGSSDYFSCDSYANNLLFTDYFSSPLLFYTSKNTGIKHDLRNALDFRTNKLNYSNNLIQNGYRLTTTVQNYVGRYDSLVIDKSSNLKVISGVPAENPFLSKIPTETISLATVYVPPYTYTINDIRIKKSDNKSYTMSDVAKLEDRVERMEEYVTLTQAESSAVNYDIIDSQTGLSRYKSGFLVDTFDNPDIISDILDDQFSVTYISGTIIPQFEIIEAPLVISGTHTCRQTGDVITLPYTEKIFAQQPVSSKTTNVNPFSVFSWQGTMTIQPKSDSWEEIQNLPSVLNVSNKIVDNTVYKTVTETVTIRRPWNWIPDTGAPVAQASPPTPVVAAPDLSFGGGCFTGETNITMFDGTHKKISDIIPGDLVMSRSGSYSEVLYVESLENSMWNLYSPEDTIAPFATINHPFYIDGQLTLPKELIGLIDYTWLGPISYTSFNNVQELNKSRVCVYNLWLDEHGDGSYFVNDLPTTSILLNTKFLRNIIKYDYATHDQCMNIINTAQTDIRLLNGSYEVSRVLGKLDSRIIDKVVADILNNGKVSKKILFGFLKFVGSILLNKK